MLSFHKSHFPLMASDRKSTCIFTFSRIQHSDEWLRIIWALKLYCVVPQDLKCEEKCQMWIRCSWEGEYNVLKVLNPAWRVSVKVAHKDSQLLRQHDSQQVKQTCCPFCGFLFCTQFFFKLPPLFKEGAIELFFSTPKMLHTNFKELIEMVEGHNKNKNVLYICGVYKYVTNGIFSPTLLLLYPLHLKVFRWILLRVSFSSSVCIVTQHARLFYPQPELLWPLLSSCFGWQDKANAPNIKTVEPQGVFSHSAGEGGPLCSCTFFLILLSFFFLIIGRFFRQHFSPVGSTALWKEKVEERWGLNGSGEEEGLTLGASFLKPDSPQIPLCYSSTAFPGLWKINVLCTANSS